jgi:leader peptidase (prepilin peptidase) / N-methyltransferase
MAIKRSDKRKRVRSFLLAITIVTGAFLLLSAAGLPYLTNWAEQESAPAAIKQLREVSWLNTVQWISIQIIVVLWIFALGSTIGSFLNVLVYRLPRGKTILGGSKCPYCAVPIKLYHNVPVFGWLWLGGRCHACRLPISPRYPIVELVAGLGFLFLFITQLLLHAGSIAEPAAGVAAAHSNLDVISIFFTDIWDILRYGWHCVLFSALLTIGLIQWDRQPLPLNSLSVFLLITLVLTIVFPGLWVINFASAIFVMKSVFMQTCLTVLLSLLLVNISAVALYAFGRRLTTTERSTSIEMELQLFNLTVVIVMIGVWIGWQGMLIVLTLGLVNQVIVQRIGLSRVSVTMAEPGFSRSVQINRPLILSLCLASVVVLGFHGLLTSTSLWPPFNDRIWISLIWVIAAVIAYYFVWSTAAQIASAVDQLDVHVDETRENSNIGNEQEDGHTEQERNPVQKSNPEQLDNI